jgi:hypothetical protein
MHGEIDPQGRKLEAWYSPCNEAGALHNQMTFDTHMFRTGMWKLSFFDHQGGWESNDTLNTHQGNKKECFANRSNISSMKGSGKW